MQCPTCNSDQAQRVLRHTPLTASNLRRRVCLACGAVFTTKESIETIEPRTQVSKAKEGVSR